MQRFNYFLNYGSIGAWEHDVLISDVLYRAKQLLEIGWCDGALAVDKDGHDVEPWSEKAVKWCEVGAVKAVTHHLENSDAAERCCLSMITVASPNLLKHDSKQPMMTENDNTNQQRAVEMATRAWQFALNHPMEIENAR